MNPERLHALENLPLDERRSSRLEPYRDLILRWRRQGRTFRRIAQILRDECHVKVAYGTLHEFVQRYSRPRKPISQPDIESTAAVQPVQDPTGAALPARLKPRLTNEERIARAETLRSGFKPLFEPEAETKPLFEYDPDKPLTLKAKET